MAGNPNLFASLPYKVYSFSSATCWHARYSGWLSNWSLSPRSGTSWWLCLPHRWPCQVHYAICMQVGIPDPNHLIMSHSNCITAAVALFHVGISIPVIAYHLHWSEESVAFYLHECFKEGYWFSHCQGCARCISKLDLLMHYSSILPQSHSSWYMAHVYHCVVTSFWDGEAYLHTIRGTSFVGSHPAQHSRTYCAVPSSPHPIPSCSGAFLSFSSFSLRLSLLLGLFVVWWFCGGWLAGSNPWSGFVGMIRLIT